MLYLGTLSPWSIPGNSMSFAVLTIPCSFAAIVVAFTCFGGCYFTQIYLSRKQVTWMCRIRLHIRLHLVLVFFHFGCVHTY
jgi:hypothetical protein